MYNNIGLPTARGSGTAGYVEKSRFSINPRPSAAGGTPKAPLLGCDAAARDLGWMRKPNQVEVRLLELKLTLEEQGYTDAEIEDRVGVARVEAAAAVAEEAGRGSGGGRPPVLEKEGLMDLNVAARKEKQLDILRAALRLSAEDETNKGDDACCDQSGDVMKYEEKGKNEKQNAKKNRSKSSRFNKYRYSRYDSDSDHDHGSEYVSESDSECGDGPYDTDSETNMNDDDSEDKQKCNSNSETGLKKSKQGKSTTYDSGNKKRKHVETNQDDGKKKAMKIARHDYKDEKPLVRKYKNDSYSDSGSDYYQKRQKNVKAPLHESNEKNVKAPLHEGP